MQSNDIALLETIVDYCDEISSAVVRFSIDESVVMNDADFRALLAFFVLQIGEMAKKLSKDFTDSRPEIQWKAIAGFRDYIAHAYGRVMPEILWSTIRDDIPELRKVCVDALSGIDKS